MAILQINLIKKLKKFHSIGTDFGALAGGIILLLISCNSVLAGCTYDAGLSLYQCSDALTSELSFNSVSTNYGVLLQPNSYLTTGNPSDITIYGINAQSNTGTVSVTTSGDVELENSSQNFTGAGSTTVGSQIYGLYLKTVNSSYSINTGSISLTGSPISTDGSSIFSFSSGFLTHYLATDAVGAVPYTMNLSNASSASISVSGSDIVATNSDSSGSSATNSVSLVGGLEGLASVPYPTPNVTNTNVEITNEGIIDVTSGNATNLNQTTSIGSQAFGALGTSYNGYVLIENKGSISAKSSDVIGYTAYSTASGIVGLSNSGSVTLINSGTINVATGNANAVNPLSVELASGIYANPIKGFVSGDSESSVDKTINNSGVIVATGGGGNGINAVSGIYAGGNAGFVSIVNSGQIITSGSTDPNSYLGSFDPYDIYAPHSAGIYASTTNNIIQVTNDGTVNSQAESAISVRNDQLQV